MPARLDRPITICGHGLKPPRHMCCFFDSRDQQYDFLIPYSKEGLSNGEEVLCIMEGHFVQEHRARHCASGIDVAASESSGQLKTTSSDDAYLAGGRFDKAAMYGLLPQRLEDLRTSPFSGVRTSARMTSVL